MAQALPIVHSADAHFGGTHTRNRKVMHWATCETCPSERKRACSSVCTEMERYLGANGNTTTHNSPTPNQAQHTVSELTYECATDAEDGGRPHRRLSEIMRDNPAIVVSETPETLLLREQAERENLPPVLLHIDDYCNRIAKGNARTRSILESVIILHFLEGYNTAQVAEMLGQRWSEYAGYGECTRRTGKKAGFTSRTPKSAYKVWRMIQRFQRDLMSPCFEKSRRQLRVTPDPA